MSSETCQRVALPPHADVAAIRDDNVMATVFLVSASPLLCLVCLSFELQLKKEKLSMEKKERAKRAHTAEEKLLIEGVGTIDQYKLVERVGQGEFGVVFRAQDTRSKETLAVKELK